jgi:hypothetical protein
MLVIGEMGKKQLSPEFRSRLEDYLKMCRDYEAKADNEAVQNPILYTLSGRAIDSETFIKGTIYTQMVTPDLLQMRNTRPGLFSDLVPKNPLEKVLVQMSAFDPDQRISAEEALKVYQQPVI